MKLGPDALGAHLKDDLAPIYVVFGEEPLGIIEAADAIRKSAYVSGYRERIPLYVGSGFDWNLFTQECSTLSLFAQRRLVDLRVLSRKLDTVGSGAILALCEQMPSDLILLVSFARSDRQVRNSKWLQTVEKIGVIIESRPIPHQALPTWIRRRLQRFDLESDGDAVDLIADRCQGNLLAARQAIERLVLLAQKNSRISLELAQRAVGDNARFDVFDLTAAALRGEIAGVARILEGLRQTGVEPTLVLWALAREIRILAQWSWAATHRSPEARPKVWASRRRLYEQAARRGNLSHWQDLLARAAESDRIIKGRSSGKPWQALRALAFAIAHCKEAMTA